jgi:hypothetical protein
MDSQDLRAQLARLRAELDKPDLRDAAVRQEMLRLLATIEQQLEQAPDRHRHENLLAELDGAITRFEVEHPRLTASLAQIVSALAAMGI